MREPRENDREFNAPIPTLSSVRGFTLVEALVVVCIIAILIALSYRPFGAHVLPHAAASAANNLRQIALALHSYEQVHKALPPAYTVDVNGRPLHSWRTLILPYLEQEPLYQTIDLSKPWNAPANAKVLATVLPVFRCPEAVEPQNRTTYLAIAAPNGCFLPRESRRLAEITDAHASTLMVIEAGEENAVSWMTPVDADESLVLRLGPTSQLHHSGGTHACLVDNHVVFLKVNTPATVRRALMSITGNDDDVAKEW